MGEVYRARDTKLDRDVAIKILPAAVAQDPERLARLEREAKVSRSQSRFRRQVPHIQRGRKFATGRSDVAYIVLCATPVKSRRC